MKKVFIIMCFIMLSVFLINIEVNASNCTLSECPDFYDHSVIMQAKTCKLVLTTCSYGTYASELQVEVNYQYKNDTCSSMLTGSRYQAGLFWPYVRGFNGNDSWKATAAAGNGYLHAKNFLINFGSDVDNLTCPKYIKVKKNSSGIILEGTSNSEGENVLALHSDIYDSIQILALSALNNVDYNMYVDHCVDFKNYIITETKTKVNQYYNISTPISFINKYLNDERTDGISFDLQNDVEFVQAYNNKIDEMKLAIDLKLKNGEITNTEADTLLKYSLHFDETIATPDDENDTPPVVPDNNNDILNNNEKKCNSLLGDLTPIVENILKTVQYAGPVLVGVLTIVDFIKASINDDSAGEMKKASQKLFKRLIAAVLLFFIPLLVNLLFGLANITAPDSCLNI